MTAAEIAALPLPHMLREVARRIRRRTLKTCPNPDCPGGWIPDYLKNGNRLCPVCGLEWNDGRFPYHTSPVDS